MPATGTWLAAVSAALLVACGGGGGGATGGGQEPISGGPSTSPIPTETDPTSASGPIYYFSDCQSGAATGCVPGDNANAGTSPSAPKRDLSGFSYNTVPAGTRLLFAQGGAWNNFHVSVQNFNASASNPLVFDSYAPAWGGTARPWLRAASSGGTPPFIFEFGSYNDFRSDGGYVVRNLKIDGNRVAGSWGFFLRNSVSDLVIASNEITGSEIGIHSTGGGADGVTRLTVRGNYVHRNMDMGMLGFANGLLIENNLFESNNFSGSNFSHAIYLSGVGRDGVLRNNTFTNNSVANAQPGGACTGGNVTVHGQWEGLLIEGNTMTQVSSTGSCWGFSITAGYTTAEWLRNVVLRNNLIENIACAVCASAAPGIVVENNRIYQNQTTWMTGISIPLSNTGAGDDLNGNAIVRDNVVCSTSASPGTPWIVPAATTVTGNVYRTGAEASTGPCAR